MSWSQKASLRFTSCTLAAFDPRIYEPLENGTWRRFERTMKGEQSCPSGLYLHAWDTATHRQRTLARSLDRMLDERPFLQVNLFDGIYRPLSRNGTEPATHGILTMVVTPEPWQQEGAPSRHCSIDWLNADEGESRQAIKSAINRMLADLDLPGRILEIRTFLFELEQGGVTELAYEIPIPGEIETAA